MDNLVSWRVPELALTAMVYALQQLEPVRQSIDALAASISLQGDLLIDAHRQVPAHSLRLGR